jgi:D-alanyl-D-alanine carboxypeptidase (penicillin-binding protein 5/6)
MAVMEVGSGRLLYQYNAQQKMPMASTTKILTAIAVIENCNLEDIVTVDAKAVGVEGSSIYLTAGQEISVEDLLYGLMLRSGNDAATALAIHTSKSVEGFSILMNKTAQKAGAVNSNFTNPHGLHDDKHYTTAEDLALISCYAMRNSDFHRIAGSKNYKHFSNKNKILHLYDGGNGVKTGFTKKAGRCLVSSASRDGMEVVCVVLNCGDMWEECIDKMDLAFKRYSMREITPAYSASIPTPEAKQDFVRVESAAGFSYPLKEDEVSRIKIKTSIPEVLLAPLPAGTEIGEIGIYLNEQLLNSEKIYTMTDIEKFTFLDYLNKVVAGW